MEPTTTPATVDEGAESAQLIEPTEDAPAVSNPTVGDEPTPTEDKTETTSEPSDDEQLTKWAENKGLTLDSDNARKAATMARNAEKAMHEKARKASELEKTAQITQSDLPADVSDSDLNTARVRNVELKQELINWRLANPDARDDEEAMTELLNGDQNLKAMVQQGYLGLDKLHAMTRGMNLDAAKAQGKREALETLAGKQQAAVPRGSAVAAQDMGDSKITPQNVDQMVASHSLDWFKTHHEEINRAMAG